MRPFSLSRTQRGVKRRGDDPGPHAVGALSSFDGAAPHPPLEGEGRSRSDRGGVMFAAERGTSPPPAA